MTNAEFYKEEIKQYQGRSDDFCNEFTKPLIFKRDNCKGTSCEYCAILSMLWLMEEYKEPEEPKIDWENVPVDTPILVKSLEMGKWTKRHFARYANGEVYTWNRGLTSFSCNGNIETQTCNWPYAKLWEGSEEQAAEKEAQCTD